MGDIQKVGVRMKIINEIVITCKFTVPEIENMIEVYSREPHDDPLEKRVEEDLRNIRKKAEDEINRRKQTKERVEPLPSEEERLTSANPTSTEHTK